VRDSAATAHSHAKTGSGAPYRPGQLLQAQSPRNGLITSGMRAKCVPN
jgi:hypothetical protein